MMTKIDLFNARNASNPVSDGLVLEVVDTGAFPDKDKDGHDVMVTALKTVSGEVYCSISANVYNSLDDLNEIIADNAGVPVKVKFIESVSGNNRKFYQVQIIQ